MLDQREQTLKIPGATPVSQQIKFMAFSSIAKIKKIVGRKRSYGQESGTENLDLDINSPFFTKRSCIKEVRTLLQVFNPLPPYVHDCLHAAQQPLLHFHAEMS